MDRQQAYGLHLRLQQELIEAFTAPVCQSGRIERLMDDLASVRREVESAESADEQSSDSMVPGLLAD